MSGSLGIGMSAPTLNYRTHIATTGSNVFLGISNQGTATGDRQLRLGFGGAGADTFASIQGTRLNIADDVNLALQSGGGTVYINATSGGYSTPRLYVDNGATTSVGFVVVSDNGGRLARFNNRDYNDTNTGSSVRFGFGAGTGDTFATINAYKSGESTTGNLVLNQSGGQVIIGGTSIRSVLGSNTRLSVSGGASIGAASTTSTGALSLDIAIDSLDGGLTLLFLASRNTAAGTSTASAVYIISFYYSDSNFPTISYLGGTSNFVSFGSSGGKLTATNSSGGNCNYSWFASK
jgi:hypothetical protein